MKKTTVVSLALVILLTLSACRSSALIGKWHSQSEGNTVIFDKNGDFKIQFWDGDSLNGTYAIRNQEEELFTVTLYAANGQEQDIKITVKGDEMTVFNQIYKKQ